MYKVKVIMPKNKEEFKLKVQDMHPRNSNK